MGEWQPIETAPRDGTVIIVPGGIAYWRHWYLRNGTLDRTPGWFTLTGCDWPGRPIHWEVQHWMPLPDPPA